MPDGLAPHIERLRLDVGRLEVRAEYCAAACRDLAARAARLETAVAISGGGLIAVTIVLILHVAGWL